MPGLPAGHAAALPRKRMAACVLLRDPAGRVLLVEPSYKDYWELPGGCVEADESPYDAAVRELSEELGIRITPGRLLIADWVPASPQRTEGVIFMFDGGFLHAAAAAQIRLDQDELLSWAWCTAAEADARLPGLQARRVRAAVRAADEQAAGYLEDGRWRC